MYVYVLLCIVSQFGVIKRATERPAKHRYFMTVSVCTVERIKQSNNCMHNMFPYKCNSPRNHVLFTSELQQSHCAI